MSASPGYSHRFARPNHPTGQDANDTEKRLDRGGERGAENIACHTTRTQQKKPDDYAAAYDMRHAMAVPTILAR